MVVGLPKRIGPLRITEEKSDLPIIYIEKTMKEAEQGGIWVLNGCGLIERSYKD